jgi:hypothetical protein
MPDTERRQGVLRGKIWTEDIPYEEFEAFFPGIFMLTIIWL